MIDKFLQAVKLSERAHRGQLRKGSNIEYFHHPLAVAADVLGRGGSYEQAMAGLCHDILEDCGPHFEEGIRALGDDVLAMVHDASDCIKGQGPKLGWYIRKLEYLLNFQNKNPGSFLVIACDKLHNSGNTVQDARTQGFDCLKKFRAPPEMVCWYFVALVCELRKGAVKGYLPMATVTDLMHNVEVMLELLDSGVAIETDNSDEGTREYRRIRRACDSMYDMLHVTGDAFVCNLH